MNNWTEEQKQKFARFQEILANGKQRYIEATGNQRGYQGGFKGKDYLSDEERQEAAQIIRQMFGVTVKDGYVHCQGRAWKLAENSTSPKEKAE